MTKIGRQPIKSTSGPPITTPNIAAADVVATASDDARTRSAGGNVRNNIAKVEGTRAAAPTCDRVRKMIRLNAFQAIAVSSENAPATVIPTR
jgi:hypothetical protein